MQLNNVFHEQKVLILSHFCSPPRVESPSIIESAQCFEHSVLPCEQRSRHMRAGGASPSEKMREEDEKKCDQKHQQC